MGFGRLGSGAVGVASGFIGADAGFGQWIAPLARFFGPPGQAAADTATVGSSADLRIPDFPVRLGRFPVGF